MIAGTSTAGPTIGRRRARGVVSKRLTMTRDHVEVTEVRVPRELADGELLVRNACTLISAGTELAMFDGVHPGLAVEGHWARYPCSPGYAAVGEVVAVGGTGTTSVGPRIGDRVFHPSPHETWSVVPGTRVVPVPDDLPNERAVFLKVMSIALTAARLAPVRFGERAAVFGLGVIGNLAAQLLLTAGAGEVLAFDRSPRRRAIADGCRIGPVHDPRETDLVAAGGAELVVDAIASDASIQAALRGARDGGRVVLLGSPRRPVTIEAYFDLHVRGLSLIGAHESRIDHQHRRADVPFALESLRTERIVVDPLVTHRIPLTEARAAYEGLRDDRNTFVGVVLDCA